MQDIWNAFEIEVSNLKHVYIYTYIYILHRYIQHYIYVYIHIDYYIKTSKSIIDKQTRKKIESKHNTNDSHQITREENKRGKEEKRPTKTNPKQLTKW